MRPTASAHTASGWTTAHWHGVVTIGTAREFHWCRCRHFEVGTELMDRSCWDRQGCKLTGRMDSRKRVEGSCRQNEEGTTAHGGVRTATTAAARSLIVATVGMMTIHDSNEEMLARKKSGPCSVPRVKGMGEACNRTEASRATVAQRLKSSLGEERERARVSQESCQSLKEFEESAKQKPGSN